MEPEFPALTDIVDRVRGGNLVAERSVCEHFRPRIICMLRVRLRDSEAAAEVANDVLLAVIKAMREGRLRQPEALAGFVVAVTRNLANNYVRAQSSRRCEQPLTVAHDVFAAVDDTGTAEQIERARGVLEQLEEPDRTILLWVLVDGLKPGEIGTRLGLPSEVVRARKSRAIKKITAQLGLRSAR